MVVERWYSGWTGLALVTVALVSADCPPPAAAVTPTEATTERAPEPAEPPATAERRAGPATALKVRST